MLVFIEDGNLIKAEKVIGQNGGPENNKKCLNFCIVEICQNIGKSPGQQRRLAVTRTFVRTTNYHLRENSLYYFTPYKYFTPTSSGGHPHSFLSLLVTFNWVLVTPQFSRTLLGNLADPSNTMIWTVSIILRIS